jgi:hypothetical protein
MRAKAMPIVLRTFSARHPKAAASSPHFGARSRMNHSFEERDGPCIHQGYRIQCASLDRQGHDPSAERPTWNSPAPASPNLEVAPIDGSRNTRAEAAVGCSCADRARRTFRSDRHRHDVAKVPPTAR